MKNVFSSLNFFTAALAASAFAFTGCDVRKTQDGEMPKVTVEGGKAPKYEVDGPEVKIEKKTIEVPDIDIVTPAEKKAGGNVEIGEAPKAPTP